MTFTPIDEIQKIALEKYNEKVEADFQALVKTINIAIKEEARRGCFSVMINVGSCYPDTVQKVQSILKEQGYDCHKTGPHFVIDWNQKT